MSREIQIDKAIYLVDDEYKLYCFLRRNPKWRLVTGEQNSENKRQLIGYTRIFRDGRTKLMQYIGQFLQR